MFGYDGESIGCGRSGEDWVVWEEWRDILGCDGERIGFCGRIGYFCNCCYHFKMSVSRDFLAFCFNETNPPSAPYKQAKMVLLKD